MTEWRLRLARADDADAMPAVERAAATLFAGEPGLGAFAFDGAWAPTDLRRLIRKGHCLVVHVGQVLTGFLVNEPFGRELHVWEMSVDPAYQRRGIGSGLMRACMIDAHNAGFAALTLTTFRDIAWNGPFYARLGFVETIAHPRLTAVLADEAAHGAPPERRCAMRCGIDRP